MKRQRARILVLGVLLLLGACARQRVVGERCPSPYAPDAGATLGRGVQSGAPFYGTSCAPCEDDAVRLDARGCPIYVTFESCGGDVCIGGVRLRHGADAGPDGSAGEDAGVADQDGGTSEEDAGAD